MDQTRRSFIQSTAILSAGAAVGLAGSIWASKMIRTHGPVDIWAYLLSEKPILLTQCTLASDEHQDLFSICIVDRGGKGTSILELPLSSMRKAVQPSGGCLLEEYQMMSAVVMTSEKKEAFPIIVRTEAEQVTFGLYHGFQFWMSREDVQRIL